MMLKSLLDTIFPMRETTQRCRAWPRVLVGLTAALAILLPASPASAAYSSCSVLGGAVTQCTTSPVAANSSNAVYITVSASDPVGLRWEVINASSGVMQSSGYVYSGEFRQFTVAPVSGSYYLKLRGLSGSTGWGSINNDTPPTL